MPPTPENVMAWRKANAEHLRAYDRAYWAKNRARKLAQQAARIAANPGKYRAMRRDWLEKNPGKAAAATACYKKNNPGKVAYSSYQNNARVRGIRFELTFDQFMEFWEKPCYYTGRPIKKIGLDRINNDLGYSIGNVVPCCSDVNMAKRMLTKAAFIELCREVLARHG